MIIQGVEIGFGKPCALIAELSCNHGQDFQRAIRMLDAAKASGASLGKIQAYSVQELIDLRGDGPAPAPWDSMSMSDLYSRAVTPREWMPGLFAYAEGIGLPLFASVFGKESLDVMESVNCPAYKLASFERDQLELRRLVKATGKPWMVSRPDFAETNTPTLYCPPLYPQKEINLSQIRKKGFAGFSYHGTNWMTPTLSVGYGASLVEVHFQLDSEPGEFEKDVSLTATQFGKMARTIRAHEAAK